jgi:methylenetetrahydrofolate reductase (NADPH)
VSFPKGRLSSDNPFIFNQESKTVTTFRESLGSNNFSITAELNLTAGADASTVKAQGALLHPVVDGVQITDNPYGQVQMSSLAAAGLLLQEGIDAIPQMACRDRNRTALTSDLIGARALGVESLILMRGDGYASASDPASVFELGAKELIATARDLSDGTDPHRFHIGCIATVFKPKKGWNPSELSARIDSGAAFIQTQLCFDMDVLRRYMGLLVAAKVTWRASIIVGIATLPTAQNARWLQKNLRGAVVPDQIVDRLEGSADPEHEGVKICAELIDELSGIPGVSGVNLMTPGDMHSIPAAIDASGVRNSR